MDTLSSIDVIHTRGAFFSTNNDRKKKQDDHEAEEDDAKNDTIIAILEGWAAWEKSLEDAAEKDEVARSIKDAADQPTTSSTGKPDTPNDSNTSHRVLGEDVDSAATSSSAKQGKSRLHRASSAGDAAQLLGPTRRERRLAQRNDPIVRARRKALKEWTAERRRSSVSAAEHLSQTPTVSGGGARPDGEVLQPRGPPPREAPIRRRSCSASDTQNKPPPPPPPSEGQTAAAGVKPIPRRYDPQARRTKTQDLRKYGSSSACALDVGEGRRRLLQTAVASSTPHFSADPSTRAGRASPWARSPSRETAGGILVKQRFFYGSSGGGRIVVTPGGVPTGSPSFESQWMRQFREEVQSNANWWVGTDKYQAALAGSAASAASVERFRGAGRQKVKQPRSSRLASITRGERYTRRTMDLWEEVSSLLASGRCLSDANSQVSGKRGGRSGGGGGADCRAGGAENSKLVGAPSFGDRLRYTPLSQGAWLLDGTERARPKGAELQPRGGGGGGGGASVGVNCTEAVRSGLSSISSPENKNGGATRLEADSSSRLEAFLEKAFTDGGLARRGGHEALRRREDLPAEDLSARGEEPPTGGGGNQGKHSNLQKAHDVILAKLRGEIDSFTREEIVLRAAEDARGALARDQAQARGVLPKRASERVPRATSTGSRFPVPDAIDYDKVEATLSLIELASRAAGPDAGKQMLQALQGLSKIHERVTVENGGSGEDDLVVPTTTSEGKGQGGKAAISADGAEEDAGGARRRTETASAEEDGRHKSAAAGGGEDESRGSEGRKVGATDRSTSAEDKGPWIEGKDEGMDRAPSRKLSLTISSSEEDEDEEEEPSGSDLTSGMVQSLSNWFMRASERQQAKQGAGSPDPETGKEAMGGLEGFAELSRDVVVNGLEKAAQVDTPSGAGNKSSGNNDGTSSGKDKLRAKDHGVKLQAPQMTAGVRGLSGGSEVTAQAPSGHDASESKVPVPSTIRRGEEEPAMEMLDAQDSRLARGAASKPARNCGEAGQGTLLSDNGGLTADRPVSRVSERQPPASRVDEVTRSSRLLQESTWFENRALLVLSVLEAQRPTSPEHEERLRRVAESVTRSAEARGGRRREGGTTADNRKAHGSAGRRGQPAKGGAIIKGLGTRNAHLAAAKGKIVTPPSSAAGVGRTRARCVSPAFETAAAK